MLGGLKEDLVCIRTQGHHKRLSQTCLWVLSTPMEAQVGRGLPQGQGLWVQHIWEAWHVSPPTEPLSRQPTNWRTIIPRSSCTVAKVLGPTTGFPTRGSGKGTENSQGIWHSRPMGFDYRISTGLGKQTLGGHKQNLLCTQDPGEGSSNTTRDWARLACKCSKWTSRLIVACHRVRGTGSSSPGRCRMLAQVLLEEVPIRSNKDHSHSIETTRL